jgi:hypothetical protein
VALGASTQVRHVFPIGYPMIKAHGRSVTILHVLLLTALSFLSRLPELASHPLLDGDECLLGLMAEHLRQGTELNIYFPGQAYGLSIFEALAGALAFAALGTGAVPLKLGILALWTAGAVFSYLALSSILGSRWRGFWAGALLVSMPAWATRSMMARGGYVTAFTFAAVVLWLVARERGPRPAVRAAAIGAALAVVGFAQPLWLLGLLPLVVYFLGTNRRTAPVASFVLGGGLTGGLLQLAASTAPQYWQGPRVLDGLAFQGSAAVLAERLYTQLTGSYFLSSAIEPGPVTGTVALVWCGLLAVGVGLQVYRAATRRWCRWSHLLALSTLSTLPIAALEVSTYGARYLLPLGQYLGWWMGVELLAWMDRERPFKQVAAAVLGLLLAGGAWSSIERQRTGGASPEARMHELVDYLESHDIHHVFTLLPDFQWQVLFYSDERVIARWRHPRDRYPSYPAEVETAYLAGERTAIVDWYILSGEIRSRVEDPETIDRVAGSFFVYPDPGRGLLEELGIRLLRSGLPPASDGGGPQPGGMEPSGSAGGSPPPS